MHSSRMLSKVLLQAAPASPQQRHGEKGAMLVLSWGLMLPSPVCPSGCLCWRPQPRPAM